MQFFTPRSIGVTAEQANQLQPCCRDTEAPVTRQTAELAGHTPSTGDRRLKLAALKLTFLARAETEIADQRRDAEILLGDPDSSWGPEANAEAHARWCGSRVLESDFDNQPHSLGEPWQD